MERWDLNVRSRSGFPAGRSYTIVPDNVSDLTCLVLGVTYKGQNPHERNPDRFPPTTHACLHSNKRTQLEKTQMEAHCWAISHMHA